MDDHWRRRNCSRFTAALDAERVRRTRRCHVIHLVGGNLGGTRHQVVGHRAVHKVAGIVVDGLLVERLRDALRDTYGVAETALEFFRVLLEDVDSHIGWEEEGLAYWACTTERQLTAARAFRERLDIEDQGGRE